MITYGVISWLIPKTYSTTLDASLDSAVNSLLTEVKNLTPMESGNLIDEFIINQNGVLIQLFDSSNREIEQYIKQRVKSFEEEHGEIEVKKD